MCFHADFSPVTAANPAKARDLLIAEVSGLGPTVPAVDPCQPFPTGSLVQVNSPVGVTVNGIAAEVINTIGWPGLVDTYRLDFRVPAGSASGMASIQITAAWITGPPVGSRLSNSRRYQAQGRSRFLLRAPLCSMSRHNVQVPDLDRSSMCACRSCLYIVARPSSRAEGLDFLEKQIESAEKRLEGL